MFQKRPRAPSQSGPVSRASAGAQIPRLPAPREGKAVEESHRPPEALSFWEFSLGGSSAHRVAYAQWGTRLGAFCVISHSIPTVTPQGGILPRSAIEFAGPVQRKTEDPLVKK